MTKTDFKALYGLFRYAINNGDTKLLNIISWDTALVLMEIQSNAKLP